MKQLYAPYWQHSKLFKIEKKSMTKEERAEEVYECQCIDADCNDCGYFERVGMVNKGMWVGRCKKYNEDVPAYPNFCSGHDCFVHRKDYELKRQPTQNKK